VSAKPLYELTWNGGIIEKDSLWSL